MRAKCIGQELSWSVPAAKWEAVLQDVRAGKPNKVTRLLMPPNLATALPLHHIPLASVARSLQFDDSLSPRQ